MPTKQTHTKQPNQTRFCGERPQSWNDPREGAEQLLNESVRQVHFTTEALNKEAEG